MLNITTAVSLDQLADACVELLVDPPADPFTPEWIATPTGGVRGWLSRRLAGSLGTSDRRTGPDGRGDGIAANIDFVRAGDLRRQLRGVGPHDATASGDPWSPDAMTWGLMTLVATGQIDRSGNHPPAARTDGDDRAEPLATWAARQARRFDHYHLHRPDLIDDWRAGHDTGDAAQARLHRALAGHIGRADPVEALFPPSGQAASALADLPERLIFFGFALPPEGARFTDLIAPVARERTVHCYFLDPAPGVDADARSGLTRIWGREDIAALSLRDHPLVNERTDREPFWNQADTNLLTRLQRHLAGREQPTGAPPEPDRSVIVHHCPGTTRQVEVLRDELLGRLVDDPTLREEDIVILCPDPEALAPVITSVLGDSAGSHDPSSAPGTPSLRYHIDGLSSRYANPVADAFAHLLTLITGRVSSLDLLGFCQLEAVRNRWDFADDDIATFRRWTRRLDVRWGVDPDHRAAFGIPRDLTMGTWARALDRLALGVAYAHDDQVVDRHGTPTAPLGVEGDDIERLGRFRDLVVRIGALAHRAGVHAPVTEHLGRLRQAVSDLLAAGPERPEDLDRVLAVCEVPVGVDQDQDFTTTLTDIRPYLLARTERRGGASGIFSGGITVTTPNMVRGVPHRVVALLDLGDHWIPSGAGDGGDLMIGDFRPGDPDPRRDARLALLAGITSAEDALVVTRTAKHPTTNDDLPEGVILGEFLDALVGCVDPATVGPATRGELVERSTMVHPRQATDPQCFTPGRPWSFDIVAHRAAGPAGPDSHPRIGMEPIVPKGDGHRPTGPVDVDELVDLLRNPDRFVARHRLAVRLPRDEPDLHEHLPVELDALERHTLRDRLLQMYLAGSDTDPETVLRAQDRLPVGVAGGTIYREVAEEAATLATQFEVATADTEPVTLPITLEVGRDRIIRGTVVCWRSRSGQGPDILVDLRASKAKDQDELAMWANLLIVASAHPDRAFRSVLIRHGSAKPLVRHLDGDRLAELNVPEAIERMVALHDVAFLGRVPLLQDLVTKKGEFRSRNSLENKWNEHFRREAPARFLYGYTDVDTMLAQPPIPQDPGFARWATGSGTPSSWQRGRTALLVEETVKRMVAMRGDLSTEVSR